MSYAPRPSLSSGPGQGLNAHIRGIQKVPCLCGMILMALGGCLWCWEMGEGGRNCFQRTGRVRLGTCSEPPTGLPSGQRWSPGGLDAEPGTGTATGNLSRSLFLITRGCWAPDQALQEDPTCGKPVATCLLKGMGKGKASYFSFFAWNRQDPDT